MNLDEGDGDRDFLMTFHGIKIGKPIPPESVYQERFCSSHLFGASDWLDFHGAYSGHQWAYPTYRLTALDRDMKPTRPVIDLEPCYENHAYHADGSNYWENPNKWDGKTRGTAALIREQAYWAFPSEMTTVNSRSGIQRRRPRERGQEVATRPVR